VASETLHLFLCYSRLAPVLFLPSFCSWLLFGAEVIYPKNGP
jgi:hypothetical protein